MVKIVLNGRYLLINAKGVIYMFYGELQKGDRVKVIWSGCSLYGQIGIVDKVGEEYIMVKGFSGSHYYGEFRRGDLIKLSF